MDKREIIYRHSGAVRITHWVNALVRARSPDERPADLQRPSRALSRIEIDLRRSGAGHATPVQHGDQRQGHHHDLRLAQLRHDRRVRPRAPTPTATSTSAASPGRSRSPAIATCRWDGAGTSSSPGSSSIMVCSISLDSPRAGISGATSCRPASSSGISATRSGEHSRLIPQGGGGEALQRFAEAFLSHRGADPSAADAVTGLPCRRAWTRPSPSCWTFSAVASRPDHPFHLGEPHRDLCHRPLLMVLVSGVWNNLRSMITGRFHRSGGVKVMSRSRSRPAQIPYAGLGAASAALLGGCDELSESPRVSASWVRPRADAVTQGPSLPQVARARIHEADHVEEFKANGSTDPQSRLPRLPPTVSPTGS